MKRVKFGKIVNENAKVVYVGSVDPDKNDESTLTTVFAKYDPTAIVFRCKQNGDLFMISKKFGSPKSHPIKDEIVKLEQEGKLSDNFDSIEGIKFKILYITIKKCLNFVKAPDDVILERKLNMVNLDIVKAMSGLMILPSFKKTVSMKIEQALLDASIKLRDFLTSSSTRNDQSFCHGITQITTITIPYELGMNGVDDGDFFEDMVNTIGKNILDKYNLGNLPHITRNIVYSGVSDGEIVVSVYCKVEL